jgi:hypothetical protein
MNGHVNVCIPTIDRFDLIRQTVKTIVWGMVPGGYKNVSITIIVDDGRQAYYEKLSGYYHIHQEDGFIKIMFNPKRLGWPKSLNRIFKETDDDFYFHASDDLIFNKNTITKAMADMKKHFPDGDGVIGITQQLGKFCPAAFGLVGRKWINRFPDRQMFYPKYVHFCGDSELWRYSRSIKRFHLSKATVHHNRPFDNCKKLAQTTLARDRRIWFPRRDSGKFWPKFT